MKIYISPSTQDANAYAGGSNEEVQMRAVASTVVDLLRAAGHEVRLGGTASARANADDANTWGAALYVAIHSNAGGGHGTEAFYYPGSDRGRALATAVYDRVARLSLAPDRGVKADAKYVELNRPEAPATIIEVAFHDNAEEAAWIRANHGPVALAITEGVLAVAGGEVARKDDCGWFVAHVRDGKSTAVVRACEALGVTGVYTAGLPVMVRADVVSRAKALGRWGVEHWREL